MVRILIVDDESSVRAPLRRALELDGHIVSEASDGAEGLDKLLSDEPGYDLLISDIRMPVMDGIALALSVAAQKPGFPIVLMTGYAEQRERAKELEGLVRDVLSKPFSLSEFRAAIRAVISTIEA
jgi:two-component system, cell cycle response regulator CpdR